MYPGDFNDLGYGLYYAMFTSQMKNSTNIPFTLGSLGSSGTLLSLISRENGTPHGFQICFEDANDNAKQGVYIRKCSEYYGWSLWSKLI